MKRHKADHAAPRPLASWQAQDSARTIRRRRAWHKCKRKVLTTPGAEKDCRIVQLPPHSFADSEESKHIAFWHRCCIAVHISAPISAPACASFVEFGLGAETHIMQVALLAWGSSEVFLAPRQAPTKAGCSSQNALPTSTCWWQSSESLPNGSKSCHCPERPFASTD